ncbi:MAG: KH domain-containing protein [Polyangiaceae bacterium]
MGATSQLGELVGLIARALVDRPDAVEINEIETDRGRGELSRIELRVAREDIGKVIGKDGRTAQSIRALLAAAASRLNKRALLDIVD